MCMCARVRARAGMSVLCVLTRVCVRVPGHVCFGVHVCTCVWEACVCVGTWQSREGTEPHG